MGKIIMLIKYNAVIKFSNVPVIIWKSVIKHSVKTIISNS